MEKADDFDGQEASLGEEDTGDKPVVDFDDVLTFIGEFGFYQKCLFLLMIPFACSCTFVYLGQIFITLVPESHWCRIPELQDLTEEERLALGVPRSADGGYERCVQYDVNFTRLLAEGVRTADPSWPTAPCKNGWEFNLTEVPYESIAAELEWVCDNAILPSLAQSAFFLGAIAGSVLFGWVADRYGRVPALVGSNMMGFAAGMATAWSTSFWTFSVYRFLTGCAVETNFGMMYILVLEYVGPKWRTFVTNMSEALFATAFGCLLPWLAYWLADWRALCVATSVPQLLAAFTPWLVPESARWLVSQGRVKEAIVNMKKVEKANGKTVPSGLYHQFQESCMQLKRQEDADKKYSVIDVLRSTRLRNTTLLLVAVWVFMALLATGHLWNVSKLGTDVFITFTLAAATRLPACTFITIVLDRWGRRWVSCGSMVVCGVFSFVASALPPGVLASSLAVFGRFTSIIAYSVGTQWVAELVPTVVRAQSIAFVAIVGNAASTLTPFIIYLSVVNAALPLLIFGVFGVVGGVLTLFLPETLGKKLPQTLADGEVFGQDQRFFDFPCSSSKMEDELSSSDRAALLMRSQRDAASTSAAADTWSSATRKNYQTFAD